MKLQEKTREAILQLQKKYPEKRSALIPALHLAQLECGYLPLPLQEEVAHLFHIDPAEVHAIVSFYDMFYEAPVGKHLIHVCKNASCMLKGSDTLLEALCAKLKIAPGETSVDGQFTLLPSECLAACDKAPMMLIDDEVVGPVELSQLEQILEQARQKSTHPCPVAHSGREQDG